MNFYKLGQEEALDELGMDEEQLAALAAMEQEGQPGEEEQMGDMSAELPPELLAQLEAEMGDEGGITSADDFIAAIQGDETEEATEQEAPQHPPNGPDEKKPRWGGASSLEGGDEGTRNHEMGLPTSGAV